MNRRESQALRLKQLSLRVRPDTTLSEVSRPVGGWLRAVRQALGLSLGTVGKRLKVTPQGIHSLEKSEAAGTISLRQLELVADAMGCSVVYSLVPMRGSFEEMVAQDQEDALRAVEHSMALEGQAVERPKKGR